MMKKVQIDPATQRRPTSRKQNRSAKIKEQLTQQVEVQVIPAKTDVEGYRECGGRKYPADRADCTPHRFECGRQREWRYGNYGRRRDQRRLAAGAEHAQR